MKKLILFLSIAATAQISRATVNFTLVGGNEHHFYIDANTLKDVSIHIKNNLNSDITLEYSQLEVDYPVAWDRSFCDNINCFPDFKPTGSFMPFGKTDDASMKITVGTKSSADTAVVRYIIWDKNNPQDKDTLVFNIYVRWSAATAKIDLNKATVYPNPAQNILHVESGSAMPAIISDLNGRTVMSLDLAAGLNRIDISSLAAGQYILNLHNEKLAWHEKLIKQ